MTQENETTSDCKKEMSDTQKISALQRIPILSDLAANDLNGLLGHTSTVCFPKGALIFKEGSFGEEVYLILSGKVKVTAIENHRRSKILGMLKEGDVLGEMAIIDTEYRSATAEAHEETRTLTLTSRDFLNFIATNRKITLKVMKTLCRRLRDANEEIKNFTFHDLSGRLATVLQSLAKKFPGEEDGVPFINLELTHRDLADMLGTTRESVTKLISSFKRDGAVDQKGRTIYITDNEELETWIG